MLKDQARKAIGADAHSQLSRLRNRGDPKTLDVIFKDFRRRKYGKRN